MKVLKFGGTSVGSAENIKKVAEIVKNAVETGRCAIVLSAIHGTTDALIETGRTAERGDDSFSAKIDALCEKHLSAANELVPGDDQTAAFINDTFTELTGICEGVTLLRELSPRTLDRILSFGELLSTRIVSAYFSASGIENVLKDTRDLILTDSSFGFAAVDFEATNAQVKEYFQTSGSPLCILPGFIARDAEGSTTTLGRGGSDYTAAIIAAGAGASSLEIWTDVSGMMTADPRFVKNVRRRPWSSRTSAQRSSTRRRSSP